MNNKILVTGAAGFIGYHLCESLLKDDIIICGVDNLNNYYDVNLKVERIKKLKCNKNFIFKKIDISINEQLSKVFNEFKPEKVINLAAQAGVRYSIDNPYVYANSNLVGFINIIELCRLNKIEGFIYASSSSVYGNNKSLPFSVLDRVDTPVSLYGATKRANELIAYSYSNLYNLNTTGLRFFTVYGPWGRPDMAYFSFTDKIYKRKTIEVFNKGEMYRDITYIDDIISGIKSSINKNYKFEIFNLGNGKSEKLMDMISLIEDELKIKAKIKLKGMQPGDMINTFSDNSHSKKKLNFKPTILMNEGLPLFINWYKNSYIK